MAIHTSSRTITSTRRNAAHRRHGEFAVDETHFLEIHGTMQQVRICARNANAPPLLVVQAGPGLPAVSEAPKFQRLLRLEDDFAVVYWDQRGCGKVALGETASVSLATQICDSAAVIDWVAQRLRQRVLVLGISLGATTALLAACSRPTQCRALVAASMDTDVAASDASALHAIRVAAAEPGGQRFARWARRLGEPPYTTTALFQLRARALGDLGGIEHGRRFAALLRESLRSWYRAYGALGTAATLRNMFAVQRRMLPEVASLNLLDDWPEAGIPVHCIFGGVDPLAPPTLIERISRIMAPSDRLTVAPGAGHMVHFDDPNTIRTALIEASKW